MADKLKFGMVGGGEGAFIGQVHRMAAEMDGLARLVCGAFSSDPDISLRSGVRLYSLPEQRCYPSYTDMFAAEAKLPSSERMDFVVIATPNHTHFDIAKCALEGGFHVVCDKPVTVTVEQALELQSAIDSSGLNFALTHNYTGYPMIKEARELVRSNALGSLRRISCDYLQGWLSSEVRNKQADWRVDPERAGAAGCFGDIGSHAENLVSYVSGEAITSVCADLSTFVPGRELDDDGNVLLRFRSGARGVISASQIAVGCENDLSLAIYGELGSIEWRQSDANSLIVRWPDRSYEVRRSAGPGVSENSVAGTRIPAGHPEGYLEGFANIYRSFFARMSEQAREAVAEIDYPDINDGIRGMRFIDAVVRSSSAGAVWVNL